MAEMQATTDPQALVVRLAEAEGRQDTLRQLIEIGLPARDAVVEGLRHANWQIRRWCALWLDPRANAECA